MITTLDGCAVREERKEGHKETKSRRTLWEREENAVMARNSGINAWRVKNGEVLTVSWEVPQQPEAIATEPRDDSRSTD